MVNPAMEKKVVKLHPKISQCSCNSGVASFPSLPPVPGSSGSDHSHGNTKTKRWVTSGTFRNEKVMVPEVSRCASDGAEGSCASRAVINALFRNINKTKHIPSENIYLSKATGLRPKQAMIIFVIIVSY